MCDHDFIPTETGFHFQSRTMNDSKAATLYCFKLPALQSKGTLALGEKFKCGQKCRKSAVPHFCMAKSAVRCGKKCRRSAAKNWSRILNSAIKYGLLITAMTFLTCFFHIQVFSEYFDFIQCPRLSLDRHYCLLVI